MDAILGWHALGQHVLNGEPFEFGGHGFGECLINCGQRVLDAAADLTRRIGSVQSEQAGGRLVRRVEARVLLGVGAIGSAVGGVALLLFVTTGAGLWPLLTGFFVVVTSVGLVLPNAAALGLEHHGSNAGAAAALLGFGQYLFGGLAAPLVGIHASDAALPTAVVIAGLGIAAVITLVTVLRHAPSTSPAPVGR